MSGADMWMPMYIGDYLADTGHLTQAQHGAYLLLLMALWRQNGKFPDDDDALAAVTRSTPQEWKRLRPILARFCTVANGVWTQKRVTSEIENAERRYKSKVENGRLGGLRSGRTATMESAPGERPLGDRLVTGSHSLGRSPIDGAVQPQPQPQVEPLSVVPGGRSTSRGRGGRP
jgi:uncharacterized protein YdaU (DUF1376 family)